MTAQNTHIGRVVGVDAVRVCHVQIVQNANLRDQHVVAARRVQGPEGRVLHDHIGEGNVVAVLDIDQGRTGIKITGDVIGANALDKGVSVAVDGARAGNRDIVRVLGVDKGVRRFERDRRADVLDAVILLTLVGVNICIDVGMRAEQTAALEVQINAGFEDNRACVIGLSAFQHDPAAACCRTGVDRCLNRRCVIGDAVGLCAKILNVINHLWILPLLSILCRSCVRMRRRTTCRVTNAERTKFVRSARVGGSYGRAVTGQERVAVCRC